jgi:hypothetical protein
MKIKFMRNEIHCKKSTYTILSSQWNQGARVNHLVDIVVKVLFTLKDANVKISSILWQTCPKRFDMSRY